MICSSLIKRKNEVSDSKMPGGVQNMAGVLEPMQVDGTVCPRSLFKILRSEYTIKIGTIGNGHKNWAAEPTHSTLENR